jgi:hypothetical protein
LIREEWHVCPNHFGEIVDRQNRVVAEIRCVDNPNRRRQLALVIACIPELVEIAKAQAERGDLDARAVLQVAGMSTREENLRWAQKNSA